MDVIIGFSIAIAFWLVVFTVVFWINHILSTRKEYQTFGYAGYGEFSRQFRKVDWLYNPEWSLSLFGEHMNYSPRKDEIFAGAIKFNNHAMIIRDPISFMLVQIHVFFFIQKKYKSKETRKKKVVVNRWR